jgi:uncharacterized membrane protein
VSDNLLGSLVGVVLIVAVVARVLYYRRHQEKTPTFYAGLVPLHRVLNNPNRTPAKSVLLVFLGALLAAGIIVALALLAVHNP